MQEKSKQNWKSCSEAWRRRVWLSLRVRANVLGMLMLAAMLSGCQTTTLSGGTESAGGADFCAAARAIYYSRHDTAPTIAQIREHNAVGVALKCEWLPAKKAPKS